MFSFSSLSSAVLFFVFFFNDTATTEIYTLSLHDALPIPRPRPLGRQAVRPDGGPAARPDGGRGPGPRVRGRLQPDAARGQAGGPADLARRRAVAGGRARPGRAAPAGRVPRQVPLGRCPARPRATPLVPVQRPVLVPLAGRGLRAGDLRGDGVRAAA